MDHLPRAILTQKATRPATRRNFRGSMRPRIGHLAPDLARLAIDATRSRMGAVAITPPLDVDRVATGGYFLQFGVPWGWRDLDRQSMSDASSETGERVVAGVIANRTDADHATMSVAAFDREGHSISQFITRLDPVKRSSSFPNGRLRSHGKYYIDRELSLMISFSFEDQGVPWGRRDQPAASLVTTEFYVIRRGQGFKVQFTTGASYHDRYLPCLWTMLGTWQWLR